MNVKFFENVLKYGSVLVGCVVVGIIARKIYIDSGGDAYTGNAIMWSAIAGLFIIYSGIVMILNEVSTTVVKKRNEKKTVETQTEIEPEPFTEISNAKETGESSQILEGDVDLELSDEKAVFSIEEIRTSKAKTINKLAVEKKNIALKYALEEFALYLSNEDLIKLCKYVSDYADRIEVGNVKPLSVKDLRIKDLQHFDWNIWNHFRIGDQIKIAMFLKTIFKESFKQKEIESIVSHLKNDKLKGIIKTCSALSREIYF